MLIFVSYSARDVAVVEPLVVQLGLLGHDVQFEHKTLLGELSWEEVAQNIRSCDAFLLTLTPSTLVSYAHGLEHQYARALGKPLITGLLMTVLEQIPPEITNIIDLRELDSERIARLSAALDSLPPAMPPAELPPLPNWEQAQRQLLGRVLFGHNSRHEQAAILLNIEEFFERRETFAAAVTMLATFGARVDLFEPVRAQYSKTTTELKRAKQRKRRRRWSLVLPAVLLLLIVITGLLVLRVRNSGTSGITPTSLLETLTLQVESGVVPSLILSTSLPPSATVPPTNTSVPATSTLIAPLTNTPLSPTATVEPPLALNDFLGESHIGLVVDDSPQGVLVSGVGATAAAAGVEVGDIVLAVDLQEVSSAEDFYSLMNERNPFARVNLRLRRGGIVFAVITLGVSDYALPTAVGQ